MSQLLKAGASPDQRIGSATPLMIAVLNGQVGAARALIEAGASVHAMDDNWRGLLAYAQYGRKNKVTPQSGMSAGV